MRVTCIWRYEGTEMTQQTCYVGDDESDDDSDESPQC